MFVVRPLAVIEDGVLRSQIGQIRIEPCIDVFRFDRNNAAIMTGGCDFWRRLVSDCRK
ncbi:hypothetical protein R70199_02786 [Paraburkholderia domus]|jgi:hypothetical protein|nr:hypothetical protein R70199_02786 [Paraburkholderia domus]